MMQASALMVRKGLITLLMYVLPVQNTWKVAARPDLVDDTPVSEVVPEGMPPEEEMIES